MTYEFSEEGLAELLEQVTEEDSVLLSGGDFLRHFAKNAARGRKPIEIDTELFDSTVRRWQAGEITAREAMSILNLKPNTFYRRIKERTEAMLNLNNEERRETLRKGAEELRTGFRTIAGQAVTDFGEVKAAVQAKAEELGIKGTVGEVKAAVEAKAEELGIKDTVGEVKAAVEAKAEELGLKDKAEALEMQGEMLHEKLDAEIAHMQAVSELREEVDRETAELKKLNQE